MTRRAPYDVAETRMTGDLPPELAEALALGGAFA